MRNIFIVFTLCLLFSVTDSLAASQQYKIFKDTAGNVYLEVPQQVVLIQADVAIPRVTIPKDGLLKLSPSGERWELAVLTQLQRQSLNSVPDSTFIKSIRSVDFDGDGSTENHITFKDNQPPITVSGLTSVAQMATPMSGVPQVVFIHTDVLGSVVAETDANGNEIKRTQYKPFGEVVNN